jgi:hypothetical protein
MLERMTREGDTRMADVDGDSAFPCEPARLLEIAFDLDVAGDPVTRAAAVMLKDRSSVELLNLLDLIDLNTAAARTSAAVWQVVADVAPLPALLGAPRPDFKVVQRLVQRLGLRALPPLVDALASVTEPARREQLVLRILALGPSAAPLVAERLTGAEPTHARELLALIARLAPLVPPFQVRTFLTHPDALLRREAVRLLVGYGDTREAALLAAVRDEDTRVLSVGLLAAQENCSPRTAATIRQRLDRGEIQDAVLRAAAVRSVSLAAPPGRASDEIVEWLISKVLRPTRVLRGPRIGTPSAELCAALAVLATKWSMDRRVQLLVQLALLDESAAVRKAAGGNSATAAPAPKVGR